MTAKKRRAGNCGHLPINCKRTLSGISQPLNHGTRKFPLEHASQPSSNPEITGILRKICRLQRKIRGRCPLNCGISPQTSVFLIEQGPPVVSFNTQNQISRISQHRKRFSHIDTSPSNRFPPCSCSCSCSRVLSSRSIPPCFHCSAS